MPDQYRHAGTFWPANAGGEHPNVETILGLPGSAALIFIVADSARYWWRQVKARADLAVWRGLPRPEKLPAMLSWDAKRVAAECVNLWDEAPHGGTEWFTPLNELQFHKESGEDWQGYADMAAKLGRLRVALRAEFDRRGQGVRILFPAWVPGDDLDDERIGEWLSEACQWDGVRLHAYNNADEIRARYWKLREALTQYGYRKLPILIDEWNANHTGADERPMLEALADIGAADPAFLGATYFIWETNNAGENDLSVWGNSDRLALFRNPPLAAAVPPVDPPPDPPEEPKPVPTVDPWQYVTAEHMASATECPLENVQENWPRIVSQLALCGINDRAVQIAMAGTIAKESASTFAPVREAFWLDEAARWAEYTRRNYGGGPNYHGRGFIQVTHRSNYQALGPKIATLWGAAPSDPTFDLVANPDNLLNSDMSAAAAAIFFRDTKALPTPTWPAGYGLVDAARAADYEWVRRLVYGGRDPDGEARIARIAAAFTGGTPVPTPTRVTFNAAEPAHPQDKSFDCSQESLEWALWALGRKPADSWLESTMVAEGVMSPADGLLDASGAGLAAFVRRQYGEFGFDSNSEPAVSWDALVAETNPNPPYPILLGGRTWGHWSGVRGFDPARGLLLLANPSEGWKNVGQTMSRAQWDALGPFSLVRVLHPDLLAPAPPPPPPLPQKLTLEDLLAGLRAITAIPDDRLSGRAIRAEIDALLQRV